VLTLSDEYIFGADITMANFVSFSYRSDAISYTIFPDSGGRWDY
jgi:hypothetical protein